MREKSDYSVVAIFTLTRRPSLRARWHRLGISVKGNTLTTIVDCDKQQNRPIRRLDKETITNSGIILLAQQIDDNTFFKV